MIYLSFIGLTVESKRLSGASVRFFSYLSPSLIRHKKQYTSYTLKTWINESGYKE